MTISSIHADIDALSRGRRQPAPELGHDNTEAVSRLARFFRACNVSAHAALAMLMKYAVEVGYANDGQAHWPAESLRIALLGAYDLDWDRHKTWLTLTEIAGMRLHTLPLDSPEIAFYEKQLATDQAILSGASAEDRASFESLKTRWRHHHGELDQLLLHRENMLLQRESVRQDFMRRFPHYLEEREQKMQLARIEFKLDALREDPTLCGEELDERAEKHLEEAFAALGDDRRRLDYALTAGEASLAGFASQRALTEFRKRLKVLFMLLHPDRLLHVPLTDRQRTELRLIWDDCQGVNIRNASEHDLARTRELVDYSIERARAILAQAGIDIDPGLVIRGDNLEERTLWLERAILRIQRDLDILRDELKAWRDDKEIAAMSALLSQSDEQQAAQHRAMQERAADCAARIALNEEKLDRLLSMRRAS